MAREFRPVDRDTPMLLPPDLREWLPGDHLAWLVIEVVGACDLSAIERSFRRGGVGRAAYDPRMLTTLLVYAYCQGVRSSRAIERACVTDVAFRVIAGQQRPDHTTLARFRAGQAEPLAELFGQVLTVCAEHGLGRVGIVAVDGTKIAANASIGASRSVKTLRRLAGDIVAEAGAVDAAEDAGFGVERRGDELPAGLAPGADRAGRIREALQQATQEEQARRDRDVQTARRRLEQLNATADRHRRAGPGGGPPRTALSPKDQPPAGPSLADPPPVGSAEAAAEEKASRTGAAEGPSAGEPALNPAVDGAAGPAAAPTGGADRVTDARLRARLKKAAERLETAEQGKGYYASRNTVRRNTTDPDSRVMNGKGQGFLQGFNAQIAVSDDHLILATDVTNQASDRDQLVPMMALAQASVAESFPGQQIGVIVADAGYCSVEALTAAGPDRLVATGRDPAKPASNPTIKAMAARLAPNTPDRARYQRRACTVETVFGHLKDRVGLRRFSRRGLQAARHELALAATAHNIRRLAMA